MPTCLLARVEQQLPLRHFFCDVLQREILLKHCRENLVLVKIRQNMRLFVGRPKYVYDISQDSSQN